MKPSLQLKLGQQLTMTPQLQQAIRLLQLSAIELRAEIETALEENPLLELAEPIEDASREESILSAAVTTKKSEREEDPIDYRSTSRSAQNDRFPQDIESFNTANATLHDHLMWQMELTPFTDKDRVIALTLIEAINENGFLTSSIQDIMVTLEPLLEIDTAEVMAVLRRIQQFEPLGVGARDVSEYLRIQLENLSPNTPWRDKATCLVTNHLDLLGKKDYTTLKRRLGLNLEQLQSVIQCIQSLHPRPQMRLESKTLGYITPDVFAYKKDNTWIISLNADCVPTLKINNYYASLIKRADTSTDNLYIKQHLQEAQWLLKSIQHRNETLLKVAECIVREQQAFLEQGEEAMKPLVLHNIAEQLSLHESTISRVTAQKYLHTPRGIFELKYFFSSSVSNELGVECSSTAIKALLKKIIAAENLKKPLSDHKLAKLLGEQGIQIARRTVAKYRELLNIPPSNERKQF